MIPDFEKSWAQLQESKIQENTLQRSFTVRVYLRDQYDNPIYEEFSETAFLTNILPASDCGAETALRISHRFSGSYYEITEQILQRCNFKIQVNFV